MNKNISSLRLNYIFNTARTILTILIPIIIFPYLSRVLGPEGYGRIGFVESLINFTCIFSLLGMSIYGLREVAKRKESKYALSKLIVELSIFLLLTTILSYIGYFCYLYFSGITQNNLLLLYISAPQIVFITFSYEWFYVAMEEQRYITIRFFLIKTIQIFCLFLFVKKSDDFLAYGLILTITLGLTCIINISRLFKYISLPPLSECSIKRHIKPSLIIFLATVAITIYTSLDSIMLGSMINKKAVGYYTLPNQFVRIIIVFVNSIAAVLLPRIQKSLASGDYENYSNYLNMSFNYVFLLALPCALGLIILSPEIIYLFAGVQFQESIFSLRLLSPIVVIVSFANFVGGQVLIPHSKEKYYTIAVSVAALCNIVFNFFAIPVLKQNGAIIGTLLAETIGIILETIFAWKLIRHTDVFSRNTIKIILASMVMYLAVSGIGQFFSPSDNLGYLFKILLCTVVGVIFYLIMLVLIKEKTIKSIQDKIWKKQRIWE